MLKLLSKLILWIFGWKIVGDIPDGIKKAVIITAPHTSWWDFWIGRLTFWMRGRRIFLLIKKEAFKPPFGWLLKKAGGIPVDRRNKRTHISEQLAEEFKNRDSMYLVVTPEGTRKLVWHWKKGFYQIAMKADVPIILGFLDYPNKTGGFGSVFHPTGDYEKDIKEIAKFYFDKGARHPEKFNLSPQNIEKGLKKLK
ncbi:MAG: acyltransferase [Bacteroidetes bacterium]|nr:MAG: acyltransferase [Bacteroidota bacterium]